MGEHFDMHLSRHAACKVSHPLPLPFFQICDEFSISHSESPYSKLAHPLASGAQAVGVFRESEIVNYTRFYHIRRDRCALVPFCADSVSDSAPIHDVGYLSTAGTHERGCAILLDAIRDLPVMLRIAAPELASPGEAVPGDAKPLGQALLLKYMRQIAGAKAVVLALDSTNLPSRPGVITYVLAMDLAKSHHRQGTNRSKELFRRSSGWHVDCTSKKHSAPRDDRPPA